MAGTGRFRESGEPFQVFLTALVLLETQSRWDCTLTVTEYLKNSAERNLSLLTRYPRFRVNFPGALSYALLKEYYPDLYRQVSRYVSRHRWYPAGAALEQTDSTCLSAESVIRSVLYGYRFFLGEFGTAPADYIIPSGTGTDAGLPTLLNHCGILGVTVGSPARYTGAKAPFPIGLWVGPDGSSVTAALKPDHPFPRKIYPFVTLFLWRLRTASRRSRLRLSQDCRFLNTGCRGEALDERSCRILQRLLARTVPPVRLESSDRFFTSLTAAERRLLPRFSGDLYRNASCAGTLSANAALKRWNRKGEQLAFAAETAAVTASWVSGEAARYPTERIRQAWHRLIAAQERSTASGIAVPSANSYALNDQAAALNTFSSVLEDAAEAVASRMQLPGPDSGEQALLLFNPCGKGRLSLTEAQAGGIEFASRVRVFDSTGNSLPLQVLDQKGDTASLLIAADIPPASWTLLKIRESPSAPIAAVPFPAVVKKIDGGLQMENRLYRLKISASGMITSIYLKDDGSSGGKEFLSAPIQHVLIRDRLQANHPGSLRWSDRRKKPASVSQLGARVLITEQGPLRAAVSVEFRVGRNSKIVQTISLASGGDEELISLFQRISWQERGTTLKLQFPLSLQNEISTAAREIGYADCRVNTPENFENLFHGWFDHTDTAGEFGLTVAAFDKFSFDKPDGQTLQLTLLHTPGKLPVLPACHDLTTLDWGRHAVKLTLYPHRGTPARADSNGAALKMKNPVRVYHPSAAAAQQGKPLPDTVSLYRTDTPQITVTACKLAEDSAEEGRIILRVRENWGKTLEGTAVRFSSRILSAHEADGLERPGNPVSTFGQVLRFSIGPFGLKTFSLRLAAFPGSRDVRCTSWICMELPYNARMICSNGDAAAGSGPLFPAELIPGTIESGPVPFRIRKEGHFHAVACGGELLTLPDITSGCRADTLYLLAAADTDVDGVFGFPEARNLEQVVHIPPMTGFIGQFDTRIWEHPPALPVDSRWKNRCLRVDPGHIVRERLEWYATHMHSAGTDVPCYYGYLYRLRIDLPPGVGSIQLPRDARIKIFAVTAAENRVRVRKSTVLTDPFDYR
jgi:alpha-mannosidase